MSEETKEQLSSADTSKEEEAESGEKNMEQDDAETSHEDKSPEKSEEDVSEDKKNEDDDEEDDEEESEEDEPHVGLLEKPLVLEEGKKRERKKVERMTFQSEGSTHEGLVIKEGKGRSLGDIPYIEHKLARTKAEDAKPLHRLLYRKQGTLNEVKKNIRQFSGFPFSKDDAEYEKRVQILKGKAFTSAMIKKIMDILDIPRGGNKDTLIERLMEWLEKPKDSGRKIPQPKRKRKSKGGSEKKSKGKKDKKEKKKKKEKKTKDVAEDDDEDEEEEEEEKEDDEEESDKEESDASDISDDEEEEPPKKKAKKATPKPKEKKVKEKATPKAKAPKSAVKKKPTPKKKAKVTNEEVSDVSSESDDEPLVSKQKSKGPPTNDELKDVIKKMLDNANLEQVTMKTVLKDVFAKYPDFDLSDRKDFIKNTVKQIIS